MRRPTIRPLLPLLAACALLVVVAFAAGQGGPTDRQVIDNAAVTRGRAVYAQYCINCHGSNVKGGENGPDLIRSVVVLRDRLGNGIGPALKRLANHPGDLTQAQILDLSHFLHQRIEATATNRNPSQPPNVLTGNVEAGKAYFNGAGKCSTCHSPTGDLSGYGTRTTPINIQQNFLFPRISRGGKQIEVTVTPATGNAISGTLVRIDDFNVSLRTADGQTQVFRRAKDVKVEVRDPLAVHHELLDQYTDTDMHNIVAYLESLK
jgi:cytochrome c oxidase cbb3-type subunit III